jgi:3'-5' exoribonuclease
MKSVFVTALVPNETITTLFLVTHKEVRQKKTGEPYLSLLLADRSGEIEAKMWDNVSEILATFERDDFVKVKGLAQIYNNRPQFTIHKLRRLQDHEVELTDYFPCSARDADEMFAELMGIVESVQNPHLRALLQLVFQDERVAMLYRRAPAAKSIHHAYLGGLIEHVLSLCALCRIVAAHYRDVDVDLLVTTAILHDIGKIEELKFERSFGYTTPGQLLGHIVIGIQMITDKLRALPDFPPKLRMLLEHMILSHHGELEFGSPKIPLFLEALLFHHLDNLDSKVEAMRCAVERDKQIEGEFTNWIPALERTVLKKDRFLNPQPIPAHEAPVVSSSPAFEHAKTPQEPKPAHHPAAPEKSAPVLNTLFAEKLQAVLGKPQSHN